MSEQFYIRLRGRIQGPYTSEQLKSLAQRGQFSRMHEVSTDGVNWTRAMSRADLFPQPKSEPTIEEAPQTQPASSPIAPPVQTASTQTVLWYYHLFGTNYGPFEIDHLRHLTRTGQIDKDNLVWTAGMPEWIAAGKVAAADQ